MHRRWTESVVISVVDLQIFLSDLDSRILNPEFKNLGGQSIMDPEPEL
jgi:hypothetical protein